MGIDLAVQEAKKLGFDVKYKLFLYQDTDLSIFSSIRAMNKWRPTLIIGPRTSNKFLLLHPGVKDIMVLSPFATSDKLALLPKNFFGITLPSKYAARSQFLLIRNILRNHNVSILTEASCDSCVSESNVLLKLLKHNGIKAKNTLILGGQVSSMEIKKIFLGDNDIFVLSTLAHTAGVLMARITNHQKRKTIFIGGDGWGTWGDTEAGRLPARYPYVAYHIVPWSLSNASPYFKKFRQQYIEKYKSEPEDKMSFVSYQTLMSAIMAVYNCHLIKQKVTAKTLLSCYKTAVQLNPDYYRNLNFVIYKISRNTNKIIGVINPISQLVEIKHE